MEKDRQYFTFFRSYFNSIDKCPTEMQLPLYKAIAQYSLNFIEPDFSDSPHANILEAIWEGILPNLKNSNKNFMNGSKGGCPKGTKKPTMIGNKNAQKQNPNETETKAIKNKEVRNKNNEVLFVDESTQPKTSKFIKPTIEEVRGYCISRGNSVDAEKFYDYYEANGWKVCKNSMKDWKAAVRTWEKNRQDSNRPQQQLQRKYKVTTDIDSFDL